MFDFITILFILSLGVSASRAADVAVFAMVTSPSQKHILQPLIEQLSAHGHSITIFTDLPVDDTHPRIHKVVTTDGADLENSVDATYIPGGKGLSMHTVIDLLGTVATLRCRKAAERRELKDMLQGRKKPDLVIGIYQYGECGLGVAHKLQVPFISLRTDMVMVQSVNNMRLPYPGTNVPFSITPYSSSMNFRERLSSLASIASLTYHRAFRHVPKMDKDLKSILGEDMPSIVELEKNVSLTFVNTHVSVSFPQPNLPQIIEVGGMHLRPGNSLPEDLEDWMTGSGRHGVIYFSLGSVLNASKMQDKHRKIFLQTFSQLPQRVIWKWETGEMNDLPDNVRVYKYLPQQDILAHSSARAFITRGGILSVQETVYHGVPAVGIPSGWDQSANLRPLVTRRAAVMLTWETLTNNTLLDALNTVIHDFSYKENIQQMSSVFKDQPMSPMDTAVYWIEFVIRHKGAGHLRFTPLDVKWYQYYVLDIVLFLVSTGTFSLWILFCTMRQVCRTIRKKTLRKNTLQKKKA